MSSHFTQQWDLASGDLEISIDSPDPLPAGLVSDLGPVVAAIEDFLKTWGPPPPPPMPDWEKVLLRGVDS